MFWSSSSGPRLVLLAVVVGPCLFTTCVPATGENDSFGDLRPDASAPRNDGGSSSGTGAARCAPVGASCALPKTCCSSTCREGSCVLPSGDAGADARALDAADGAAEAPDSHPPIVRDCRSDALGVPLQLGNGGQQFALVAADAPVRTHWVHVSKIAVRDVTGDQRADVIVASDDGVWVYPQPSFDSVGTPRAISPASAMAVIDANEDGLADVVVRAAAENGSGPTLHVIIARGSGEFATEATTGAPAGGLLEVTDMDGDGHQDVVTLDNPNLYVAYGTGSGSFDASSRRTVYGINYAYDLALGDLNGDKLTDLALTTSDTVIIIGHDGLNHFRTDAARTLPIPELGTKREAFLAFLDIGDFTADGLPDIVVQDDPSFYDDRTWLFAQSATGIGSPLQLASASYSGQVVVQDLNADGRKDVVMLHGLAPLGVVLADQGRPTPQKLFEGNAHGSESRDALAVGDVDCDGCPDVVIANVGSLSILRGQGCAN